MRPKRSTFLRYGMRRRGVALLLALGLTLQALVPLVMALPAGADDGLDGAFYICRAFDSDPADTQSTPRSSPETCPICFVLHAGQAPLLPTAEAVAEVARDQGPMSPPSATTRPASHAFHGQHSRAPPAA